MKKSGNYLLDLALTYLLTLIAGVAVFAIISVLAHLGWW
jgi:ABC-type lipoprotein release transport system permease subunit